MCVETPAVHRQPDGPGRDVTLPTRQPPGTASPGRETDFIRRPVLLGLRTRRRAGPGIAVCGGSPLRQGLASRAPADDPLRMARSSPTTSVGNTNWSSDTRSRVPRGGRGNPPRKTDRERRGRAMHSGRGGNGSEPEKRSSERTCKPGPVPSGCEGDGHLSRRPIARPLQRSTRESIAGRTDPCGQRPNEWAAASAAPCLTLLPVGFA